MEVPEKALGVDLVIAEVLALGKIVGVVDSGKGIVMEHIDLEEHLLLAHMGLQVVGVCCLLVEEVQYGIVEVVANTVAVEQAKGHIYLGEGPLQEVGCMVMVPEEWWKEERRGIAVGEVDHPGGGRTCSLQMMASRAVDAGMIEEDQSRVSSCGEGQDPWVVVVG